ncbi:MAG TPA: hypothetical protein VFP92_02365 [Rhodanobacteraceae bacterium]|nr:hypothetical protein [Rhodanobacteraceae bacterium]
MIGAALFVVAESYLQALLKALAGTGVTAIPVAGELLNPDRWFMWMGLLFILSVYFSPKASSARCGLGRPAGVGGVVATHRRTTRPSRRDETAGSGPRNPLQWAALSSAQRRGPTTVTFPVCPCPSRTSATLRSSPTSTTARPPWSINC